MSTAPPQETIEPIYIITIPGSFVGTYKKILYLLADYGIDMIKDCKADCTKKNSGVIECFNMFNAAIANYNLGKEKEANLILKYIDAKIDQFYN